MIDFSPLLWGEGGESSEPGEGFLPSEPRNFGIRVKLHAVNRRASALPGGCSATTAERLLTVLQNRTSARRLR
jgi:hypothetical protein